MVWGGINLTRKTPLVQIVGNLTAQRYVDEVLRPHVAPLAAAHRGTPTGRVTTAFLVDEGIKRKVWPASSPDLNPIPVGLAEAICISPHQSNSNLAHLSHLLQGVECHPRAACHQTDQHHDHGGRPPCHDGARRSLTGVVDTPVTGLQI